jgi:hypothetical protein
MYCFSLTQPYEVVTVGSAKTSSFTTTKMDRGKCEEGP